MSWCTSSSRGSCREIGYQSSSQVPQLTTRWVGDSHLYIICLAKQPGGEVFKLPGWVLPAIGVVANLIIEILFQVQRKDPIISKLIHSLQSGSRPTARNTKCNDLKTYLSFSPRLDHDGLVVVDRVLQPTLVSLSVPIIPQNFAKSMISMTTGLKVSFGGQTVSLNQ